LTALAPGMLIIHNLPKKNLVAVRNGGNVKIAVILRLLCTKKYQFKHPTTGGKAGFLRR